MHMSFALWLLTTSAWKHAAQGHFGICCSCCLQPAACGGSGGGGGCFPSTEERNTSMVPLPTPPLLFLSLSLNFPPLTTLPRHIPPIHIRQRRRCPRMPLDINLTPPIPKVIPRLPLSPQPRIQRTSLRDKQPRLPREARSSR